MLHDVSIIDFETTGTDFRSDQVVEMAAIRLINGQEQARFSALVRLRDKQIFHPKAQEKTGLCPLHLVYSMKEANAFRFLHDFLRGSTVVSHNILFDYSFLHWGFLVAGLPAPIHPFLCTLTIGRSRHAGKHDLAALCDTYKVEKRPGHRAMNDVLMAADILRAMDEEGAVDKWLNTAGWNAWYEHPNWWPEHGTLLKQRPKSSPKPAAPAVQQKLL